MFGGVVTEEALLTVTVDLRSDTVTRPTEAMREAMLRAPVGDDVFEDDPTIAELESRAAARLGKEAALFVASGTMGNQCAVMTHTGRGDEVLCGRPCHIQEHEVGAAAALSGVTLVTLDAPLGCLAPEAIRAAIREPDVHHPDTGLLCLECAHSSGAVQPLESLRRAAEVARARDPALPVHLDGARIFNAAHALGVDAREIAAVADSVMFCLSKGLGAPVGSVLCGSRAFVGRARRARKMLGGGMRQVGLLGAAGLHALERHVERLAEDHRRAARLAAALREVEGVRILEGQRDINMVWMTLERRVDSEAVVAELARRGVRILGDMGGRWRLVTHLDVDEDGLTHAAQHLREVLSAALGRAPAPAPDPEPDPDPGSGS
jgi:threonine aldolase